MNHKTNLFSFLLIPESVSPPLQLEFQSQAEKQSVPINIQHQSIEIMSWGQNKLYGPQNTVNSLLKNKYAHESKFTLFCKSMLLVLL